MNGLEHVLPPTLSIHDGIHASLRELVPWEYIAMEIESNYNRIHTEKWFRKWF